jgi:hypothetical protein
MLLVEDGKCGSRQSSAFEFINDEFVFLMINYVYDVLE